MPDKVHWTLSRDDANVVRQALSKCAADRRIAASREVDRERATLVGGQAAQYERIAASLPPVGRSAHPPRKAPQKRGLVSTQN